MKALACILWLALSCVAAPPLFFAQNGATTVSPDDISGLVLWLDPSDSATVTTSGTSVDQIDDKSVSANSFTSTGSTRPTISAAALNGLDVMVADGVDDLMDAASPISAAGSWTVITVQRRGVSGAISGTLMNYGSELNPVPPFAALDYGPLGRTYAGTQPDQQYTTIPSHAWHVYATKNDAGTPSIRIDGVDQSMTSATATPNAFDFNSLFRRGGTTAQEYSQTDLAELVMYDRLLSDSEIEQIEAYYLSKWNVP